MNVFSGRVHLLSEYVVTRYPDIVVMGMKDWIRDGLLAGLKKVGESISNGLSDAYTFFLELTIKLIIGFGTPPADVFVDGPLGLILGGTYGLAIQIMSLLVTATAVIVVIEVARRKESVRGATSIVSIFGLAVFGVLFYPVYSLLDGFVRDGSVAMLEAFNSATEEKSLLENLTAIALPGNLVVVALVSFLGMLMLLVVALELIVMNLAIIGLVLFYPLSFAFRQAGKVGLTQFRLATAGLLALPVSMLLMTFWLCLGVAAVRLTDKLTSGAAEGVAPMVGVFMTQAGTFLCLLSPIVVMGLFYQRAVRVINNLDSKVQAGLDNITVPEVNAKVIEEQSAEHRHRILHSLEGVGTHAAQGVSDGQAVKDIAKTYVATEVAKKAAASGNPYVAAAVAGWGLYKTVKAVKSTDGEEVHDE